LMLTYAPSITGQKWFYSEIDSNCQRLQVKSVQHLFSLLAIHRSLRPYPNPRSSFPQAQIFNGGSNQAGQVNFIPVSFIRHYPFRFSLPQISPSVFLW
jgi:hypothetical protein